MKEYPAADRFTDATIILPVVNETTLLDETVRIVLRDARADIRELLIVVCDRTTPASMEVIERIRTAEPDLVVVHQQTLPFLGGAVREAFDLSRGSHALLMASDMETDPNDVGAMIAEARQHPAAIITTSRWIRKGSFHGYSPIKLLCNWIFQRFFSILYGVKLTDMTFGFRIFPTALVQGIAWEELRHPFMLETLVKPLRLGVPVFEIPTGWQARTEGESQNSFFRNFVYFRIGLKSRFLSRSSILRLPSAAN